VTPALAESLEPASMRRAASHHADVADAGRDGALHRGGRRTSSRASGCTRRRGR
jgi:hypothetical protein